MGRGWRGDSMLFAGYMAVIAGFDVYGAIAFHEIAEVLGIGLVALIAVTAFTHYRLSLPTRSSELGHTVLACLWAGLGALCVVLTFAVNDITYLIRAAECDVVGGTCAYWLLKLPVAGEQRI